MEDRDIHAGKVNCDMHQRLCQEAQVSAYPSVRFYAGTSNTRQTQVNSRSAQVLVTSVIKMNLCGVFSQIPLMHCKYLVNKTCLQHMSVAISANSRVP